MTRLSDECSGLPSESLDKRQLALVFPANEDQSDTEKNSKTFVPFIHHLMANERQFERQIFPYTLNFGCEGGDDDCFHECWNCGKIRPAIAFFTNAGTISNMNQITLVTGGARSGKSRYAVETALKSKNRVFIATAIAFDDGMQQRIKAHKSERAGRFTTIEEPYDLDDAINSIPADTNIILIDCMTVWLGNLMYRHKDGCSGFSKFKEVDAFLKILKEKPFNIIIVTNEVGGGIVPENKMARDFRDLAGRLNQNIAAIADSVILTVCGIPTAIKGSI